MLVETSVPQLTHVSVDLKSGLPLGPLRRSLRTFTGHLHGPAFLDQYFAFAGWAFAPRINDDAMHRRVDDVLFAERASKGMIEEI